MWNYLMDVVVSKVHLVCREGVHRVEGEVHALQTNTVVIEL